MGCTAFTNREYTTWGDSWFEYSNMDVYHQMNIPFRFTGKELERTQLYYYGARYYSPAASVWMSPDPILGQYLKNDRIPKNESLDFSLYSYSGNNPINYFDPDGNIRVSIAWKYETYNNSKLKGFIHTLKFKMAAWWYESYYSYMNKMLDYSLVEQVKMYTVSNGEEYLNALKEATELDPERGITDLYTASHASENEIWASKGVGNVSVNKRGVSDKEASVEEITKNSKIKISKNARIVFGGCRMAAGEENFSKSLFDSLNSEGDFVGSVQGNTSKSGEKVPGVLAKPYSADNIKVYTNE